jgi:hypothetical protein
MSFVQRIPNRTAVDPVLSQVIAEPLYVPSDLGPASVAKNVAKQRSQLRISFVLFV